MQLHFKVWKNTFVANDGMCFLWIHHRTSSKTTGWFHCVYVNSEGKHVL